MPDPDKIVLLSDIFSVSTDYLLRDQYESAEVRKATEGEKFDKQRIRSMTLASMIISALGLLISLSSISFYDTQTGFLIGLAVQVLAVVFFEMSIHGTQAEVYSSARQRFYLMNLWLLLYSPSAIITSYVLRHLPSIHELLWRFGYLAVYIMSATVLSILILKTSKKKY